MRKHIAALALVGLAFAPGVAVAYATPNEDEPGWSCVDDGNRVCGPGNSEGKPAACYDEGGVIVALWPCQPWNGPASYEQGSYVGGYN